MPLIAKKIAEKPKAEPVSENIGSSLSELRQGQTRNVIKEKVLSVEIVKKEEPPVIDVKPIKIEELRPSKKEPLIQKVEVEVVSKQVEEKGVSLLVNGEKRKVSKTSKYLLDMLTLDDQ